MKMNQFYLSGVLFSIMFLCVPLHGEDSDDTKLQTESRQIDKDNSTGADDQKVDNLAKQFKVPESVVQKLRNQGQGWGEVTIELSLARKLASTDPKMYPTRADALKKVEELRASGEGWGKIAKDLGFKLGPVISEVHHAHHEMLETAHSEKGEHEHMENQADRPEHPDHPDHPEHADHPDHPDHPGH